MLQQERDALLTEYIDGIISDADLQAWFILNPDAAEEAALVLRVRQLVARMREQEIAIPEGFERRLMARVRGDLTLLQLLDLCMNGVGKVVLEVLDVLFGMLPRPAEPQPIM